MLLEKHSDFSSRKCIVEKLFISDHAFSLISLFKRALTVFAEIIPFRNLIAMLYLLSFHYFLQGSS